VGDDDRSIYGWRRALGHEGMERFAEALRARRVTLAVNYRSWRQIVERAPRLVARNRGRLAKPIRADRGSEGVERRSYPSPAEEAAAAAWMEERAGPALSASAPQSRHVHAKPR
jgi:superfamily I DNA/RNA helicase